MLFEYLNKAFGNMSETYAYFSEEVGDRDVAYYSLLCASASYT